jgi:serine/threonine protein kinase
MIGELLGGYRVISQIGSGGMGTVFLAEAVSDRRGHEKGSKVALKVLHPQLLGRPGAFQRFLREAESGKRIDHPNVVRTYEVDAAVVDEKDVHFLVMEYARGRTLRDHLDEEGPLGEAEILDVARQVANGLAAIHGLGIVHRDLKPENLLLTEDRVVKIMDLGVAHLADEALRLSRTGEFIGSIHYAAPEQFRADAGIDGRADLHALGLVLYELATGRNPYFAEDYRIVLERVLNSVPPPLTDSDPGLSPVISRAVQTLLAKNREDRFETPTRFLSVLEEGTDSPWWAKRRRQARNRRILAAVILVMMLSLPIWLIFGHHDRWRTNTPLQSVADSRARRGGRIRLGLAAWPATLRTEGPRSASAFTSTIHRLVYETLLVYDHGLDDYVPSLATHWSIGPDLRTFGFRLDPRAKWPDGTRVTADDVVATIEHLKNPDRRDPQVRKRFEELVESATVVSPGEVEIRTRDVNWRNFLTLGVGMAIYPPTLTRMDGEAYLEKWNLRLPPGTGPYELRDEDVRKGKCIKLRRRDDWWAADLPGRRHTCNFHTIEWHCFGGDDPDLYPRLLDDRIDVLLIGRARRWREDLEREAALRNGWIQKRRIYNLAPAGFGGYCFNMRRPPFDSLAVRAAFSRLLNRERMFEELFQYEYEYTDSYFPGTRFERSEAKPVRFDAEEARRLLASEGWTVRDADGRLRNGRGETFPEVELHVPSRDLHRAHAIYQEDLWREAGIRLIVRTASITELYPPIWEHDYQLAWINWTTSLLPSPELMFHSSRSGVIGSHNVGGLKDNHADDLIHKYAEEWNPTLRTAHLRELDERLFEQHPYALGWYAPFFRIAYWDRFGHPKDYADPYSKGLENVLRYWWWDAERDRRLEENRSAGRPSYHGKRLNQYDDIENKYLLRAARTVRVRDEPAGSRRPRAPLTSE